MALDSIYSCLSDLGLADSDISVEPRRDARPFRDATIFCNSAKAEIAELLGALERNPAIASIGHAGRKITLRFEDAAVAAAGNRIAEGDFGSAAPPPSNRPVLVGFLGPNLSKALHVGHLRNAVLGNATVAMLRGAGLPARSYSLIGDIGRNVCEAMAGWCLLDPAADAATARLKSDQRVGHCYRAYLRLRDVGTADPDTLDPCHREHRRAADEADHLLQLWRSGDPRTLELWKSICALVEGGHAETLHRLGVEIGGCHRESDHLAAAEALVEEGLQSGVLARDAVGTTFFPTGLPEYPRLILARSDGFPTEHARVAAVFAHILGGREPCEHIDWNGTEWEPAQRAITKLMSVLKLGHGDSGHRPMFHGMVLIDGAELSSSEGEPLLIDDALDRLEASEELVRLTGSDPDGAARAELAALVLKSYFLSVPPAKPLAFSWARLMSPKANPGWVVAQAWIRARRAPGAATGVQPGPEYRTAVLHAESFGHHLQVAARSLRVSGLFSFLVKHSERLLSADDCPLLEVLSRSVLERSMEVLGLRPLCKVRES